MVHLMELMEYKNPTELLLEPFNDKKEEIFNQLEGYLYLYGKMGEEVVSQIGVLPPTVEALIEACKGRNAFKVLDALYKVNKAEIAQVSPKDAKNIFLLFTQTVCRHNNGENVCRILCSIDWESPLEEEKEYLVRLMNPLEYSEGASVKKLFYQNRGKVEMLKKIPPDTQVIDYADPQDYGAFIRSLKTMDKRGFVKAYKKITAISFAFLSA